MADPVKVVATPDAWPTNKDDYEVGEAIGAGTISIVHKAYCKPRNEKCAIKRIPLERENRRIHDLNEIESLVNCNHKNVMRCFAYFVVEDELWLVISLLERGSLLDIINYQQNSKNCRRGVLNEIAIATVLRKVLKALVYLHSNGIIHRDIKAENVMVSEDGNVQIAGFGMSAWFAIGENQWKDKSTESLIDNANWFDSKADIWSLGALAVEMAAGKSLYDKYYKKKVPMSAIASNPPLISSATFSSDQYPGYRKLRFVYHSCCEEDSSKRPTAVELLRDYTFFHSPKNSKFLKKTFSPFTPSIEFRVLKLKNVKRLPGTTGWRYRTESGEWIWSPADEENADSQHHSNREGENSRNSAVETLITF